MEQRDANTGTAVETVLPIAPLTCGPYDRFVVNSADNGILDTTTGFTLCYLPVRMFNAEWTASSKTSIAFATDSDIYVLHFPPWMLSADSQIVETQ